MSSLELTVMTNIDRVFGETGHLLARLDARRRRRVIICVEPSRTRRGDREQNIFVGAAAAKMAGESRADVFSRRGDRALCLPPIVMESRGFDNKPGRTEAALQRIERHEGLLYRMQSPGTHAFTVVIVFPATVLAGSRQLATGTPSSNTVQAPQTPAPHTSFVPVRLRLSRRTSTKRASGSGKVSARPLIVTVLMQISL